MSIATITPAHAKAVRTTDFFSKLRAFAAGLYAAHGGWIVRDKSTLASLSAHYANYVPTLAAELRRINAQH